MWKRGKLYNFQFTVEETEVQVTWNAQYDTANKCRARTQTKVYQISEPIHITNVSTANRQSALCIPYFRFSPQSTSPCLNQKPRSHPILLSSPSCPHIQLMNKSCFFCNLSIILVLPHFKSYLLSPTWLGKLSNSSTSRPFLFKPVLQ